MTFKKFDVILQMNDTYHHSFLDVILEVKRLTFLNVKPNALTHCFKNGTSIENKCMHLTFKNDYQIVTDKFNDDSNS